jgi:2-hydroxy-4-carboxymuconate semialdehyde hemiacetal dehydrogenase
LGLGIIGTGAIAAVHAQCMIDSNVPILGVSGINQSEVEEFSKKFNVAKSYTNHLDLLSDPNIDAVIVATPSDTHASISVDVLESGKAVLCEIPISLSLNSYLQVRDAAISSKKLAAVCQTLRYSSAHMELKKILKKENLKPLNVLVRNLMLRQENIGWTGAKRTWTDSVLWHHGAHSLDLALWLLEPTNPVAEIRSGPKWGDQQIMDINGRIESDDKRFATLNLSYHSRLQKNDVLVVTESDTFEVTNGALIRNGEQVTPDVPNNQLLNNAVMMQDLAFLSAVHTGDHSQVITIENEFQVMNILDGCS